MKGNMVRFMGRITGQAEVLTGRAEGLRVALYRSCGEPTGGSVSESQRLRVSRRSAADPLNLLRIMPAKGVTSVTATFSSPIHPQQSVKVAKFDYDCQTRFD